MHTKARVQSNENLHAIGKICKTSARLSIICIYALASGHCPRGHQRCYDGRTDPTRHYATGHSGKSQEAGEGEMGFTGRGCLANLLRLDGSYRHPRRA